MEITWKDLGLSEPIASTMEFKIEFDLDTGRILSAVPIGTPQFASRSHDPHELTECEQLDGWELRDRLEVADLEEEGVAYRQCSVEGCDGLMRWMPSKEWASHPCSCREREWCFRCQSEADRCDKCGAAEP